MIRFGHTLHGTPRISGRAKLGAVVLVAGSLVVASTTNGFAAIAVNTTFELDGNILNDSSTASPDWSTLFTTGSLVAPYTNVAQEADPPLPDGFPTAKFFRDFKPGSTSDTTTYATGSKDT